MTLYIRNMVSFRCKRLVENELTKLGLAYKQVDLGKAEIIENISPDLAEQLKKELLVAGLELVEDRKNILIKQVKNIILDLIYLSEDPLPIKLSLYLSKKLHCDYTNLSNLFSKVEKMTIEKFYIMKRIERVKELYLYRDLSLSEIANTMHYSSVSHLSAQFKKVTGINPSSFKCA